jgi:hypothetical protein
MISDAFEFEYQFLNINELRREILKVRMRSRLSLIGLFFVRLTRHLYHHLCRKLCTIMRVVFDRPGHCFDESILYTILDTEKPKLNYFNKSTVLPHKYR